jgi:Protein of unknown function (DUF2442)
MQRVVSVKAGPNSELDVVFTDGTRGTVSLKEQLFGPVFEPLKNADFFAKVSVDEFGVVCWPNGADLAPDALYERLRPAANC